MHEREHAEAREHDRRIRAQLDPLVGELSPQGKIELAFRLVMEGGREFAAGAIGRDTIVDARAELPIYRELDSERDGAGEDDSR